MPMLSRLLLTIMGALLLSNCAVKINDEQFCSPLPGNLGATCDNFLSSNQQILSQDQWIDRQNQWIASGQAVECTTSQTVGDIKAEIEKLCSVASCDESTKNAIVNGLIKIQNLGKSGVTP
jgi:hypothetical protein